MKLCGSPVVLVTLIVLLWFTAVSLQLHLFYCTSLLSSPRSGYKECLLLTFALLNPLTLNETSCYLTSKGKQGDEVGKS